MKFMNELRDRIVPFRGSLVAFAALHSIACQAQAEDAYCPLVQESLGGACEEISGGFSLTAPEAQNLEYLGFTFDDNKFEVEMNSPINICLLALYGDEPEVIPSFPNTLSNYVIDGEAEFTHWFGNCDKDDCLNCTNAAILDVGFNWEDQFATGNNCEGDADPDMGTKELYCYFDEFPVFPPTEIRTIACEGTDLELACADSLVISIAYANYGRTDDAECSAATITDCVSATSLAEVRARCNGQFECTVSASNDVFGDPCGGTTKYLETRHTCDVATAPSPTLPPTESPSAQPTSNPTEAPTAQPTAAPTSQPTAAPTAQPTAAPTAQPTSAPTAQPTNAPTPMETAPPTSQPTAVPSPVETAPPTAQPTSPPTAPPTGQPTSPPSPQPTDAPSPRATLSPTPTSTNVPSASPSSLPTIFPYTQSPGVSPLELSSARVSDSGRFILCTLSRPSASPQPEDGSCSFLTNSEPYGVSPTCRFSTPTEILIEFGAEATILIGDDVELSFDGESPSSLTAPLLAPLNAPGVSAVLSAPNRAGSCAPLTLSSIRSEGSIGRSLAYTWELLNDGAQFEELRIVVASEDSAVLEIPSSLLPPGETLEIGLQVSNWLGASETLRTSIEIVEDAVPVVYGEALTSTPGGPGVFVNLRGDVEFPCGNDSVASYMWRSIPVGTPADQVAPTRELTLAAQQASAQVLRLVPGSLEHGETYAFSLTVVTARGASASAVFGVEVDPPSVAGVLPTRSTMCTSDGCADVSVVAESRFIFPVEELKENATYVWSCTREDDGTPCFSDSEVFGGTGSHNVVVLTPEDARTIGVATVIIQVEFQNFFGGSRVPVTATASSEVQIIEVPDGVELPQIEIVPLEVQKITTDARVALELDIAYSGDPADLAYSWMSRSGNFDLQDASLLLSPDVNSSSLVFAPNALTAGVEYIFDCVVTVSYESDGVQLLQGNTFQITTSAGIAFVTNFPPSGGSCELTTTGTPLDEPFEFICREWTDDVGDMPLEYRFLLLSDTSREPQILGQFTSIPSSKAVLGPGSHTILAEIRDRFGAVTQYTISPPLQVGPLQPADGQSVTDFLRDEVLSNLDDATPEETIQIAFAVSQVLEDSSPEEAVSIREQLFEAIANIAALLLNGTPTAEEIQQLMQTINAITGSPGDLSASGSLRTDSVNLIDAIVGVALSSPYAEISPALATTALDVLGSAGVSVPIVPPSEEDVLAFAEVFDDVVYQIARGLLTEAFPGEIPQTIETDELSLRVRRTTSDMVEPVVDANATRVAFPPMAELGLDADVVDLSILQFNGPLLPTASPGESIDDDDDDDASPPPDSNVTAIDNIFVGFRPFVRQIQTLRPISPTVQIDFYNASASINKTDRGLLEVGGLSPCEPIQIRIDHLPGTQVSDNGEPVCRHWNETTQEWLSDCITVEFTNEYTICNCTHLTFFEIADWGDVFPRPNQITTQGFRQLTADNLRAYPEGWLALISIFAIFVPVLMIAKLVDRHHKRELRKDAVTKSLVLNDTYQWGILTDPTLTTKRERIFYVWLFRLRNHHRWTSIFIRQKRSHFQSTERTLVLFVAVISSLAIGCVWHGQRENRIFHWITVAFVSGLFGSLPALIISRLFMNSRPPHKVADDEAVEFVKSIRSDNVGASSSRLIRGPSGAVRDLSHLTDFSTMSRTKNTARRYASTSNLTLSRNAVTVSRSIERSASRSISSASEREISISLTRPSDESAPVSPNVTLSRPKNHRRSALKVAFAKEGGERESESKEGNHTPNNIDDALREAFAPDKFAATPPVSPNKPNAPNLEAVSEKEPSRSDSLPEEPRTSVDSGAHDDAASKASAASPGKSWSGLSLSRKSKASKVTPGAEIVDNSASSDPSGTSPSPPSDLGTSTSEGASESGKEARRASRLAVSFFGARGGTRDRKEEFRRVDSGKSDIVLYCESEMEETDDDDEEEDSFIAPLPDTYKSGGSQIASASSPPSSTYNSRRWLGSFRSTSSINSMSSVEAPKSFCGRVQWFWRTITQGLIDGGDPDMDLSSRDMSSHARRRLKRQYTRRRRSQSFSRWIRVLALVLAILWIGGCVIMILVYSILFNLSPEFVSYYEQCDASGLRTLVEDDVNDVQVWALTVAVSNVFDFFLFQPLAHLLLATLTVWRLGDDPTRLMMRSETIRTIRAKEMGASMQKINADSDNSATSPRARPHAKLHKRNSATTSISMRSV